MSERHADREQQHAEIELRLNLDVRRHAGHAPGRHDPHQRIGAEVREHDAEQAAGRGEQQRFGQHLPHQAEPAGAERTRTVISRCRAAPRASSRLATLVHASSSSRPTIAISANSGLA